jgi:hypothetical protein
VTTGPIEQFYCERCERYVPAASVVTIRAADGRVRIPGCPTCRGHVRREEQEVDRALETRILGEAIAPIFHAQNAPLLVGTTLVGFVFWRFVPFLGPVLSFAVLVAHAAQASRAAADPDADGSLGSAADFRHIGDLLGPVLRRGVVLGVGLAPLVGVLVGSNDPVVLAVGTMLGVTFFIFYTPAALVVAARAKSVLTVLSPIAPLRIAWRIGGAYVLGVGLHLLATLIGGALVVGAFSLAAVLDRYIAIFPYVLAWAVLVMVTTAQARVLGLFARQHRHVLGLDA